MSKLKEGWGWPINSKKAHYFVDSIALCGGWMFGGELESDDKGNSPDDCKSCRKKLTKTPQKQVR